MKISEKYMIFLVTIIVSISSVVNSGVMQITLNNLKNVLATYQQVHMLFHNPQCIHSRKYVQQFLKLTINQSTKLGIVDCIRQLQLCQQHNLTQYPVLAKYSINHNNNKYQFQLIDQQQFLIQHNIKQKQDDQVMANKFVNYLSKQPYYAVVIFQDYALPVIDKQRITQNQQQRLFYLQPYNKQQNPSQFTKLISFFVNNRNGCWIFKKNTQNQLEKYACDSGYSKNITMKYIKLFIEGKLKKYVFQQQTQNNRQQQQQQEIQHNNNHNIIVTSINYQQVTKILTHSNNINQIAPCGLLYVSSNKCVSCKQKDIKAILMAIRSLGMESTLQVFKFDVDKNEIPSVLIERGLKRVPQILYVCDRKQLVFGQVLFVQTITSFIKQSQLLSHTNNINTSTQSQQQKQF